MGNEIFFLSLAVTIILSFLILILFYLVWRKIQENRHKMTIEKYKKQYNSPIFQFVTTGEFSRVLNPVSSLQRKAFEELLTKYAEVLEGEQEKRNITILAEWHLKDYYLRKLNSHSWSERMNALYHIEDFKMDSLQDDIVESTFHKKTSQEEIVHALRILASLQHKQLFDFLTDRFRYLSQYEYRNILLRLEGLSLDSFILGFHRCQIELKIALLDVLGVKRELKYLHFIETVFFTYSGEVRLRALKSLASIGYINNLEPFLPLCHSSVWQERMFAAKLIGSIKDPKGLPYLIGLLHDSSWWVRSQAGQSISMYPNCEAIFREVLEESNDAFAKDMAEEWLKRIKGV